ncbi:MAG: hypothetical protein KAQ68_06920 [Clostridiales bacterium]|nr:hypothetical protein [Clostridiales bacterium]
MQNTIAIQQLNSNQQNSNYSYMNTNVQKTSFADVMSSNILKMNTEPTIGHMGSIGALQNTGSSDFILNLLSSLENTNPALQILLSVLGSSSQSDIGSIIRNANNKFGVKTSRQLSNGLGVKRGRIISAGTGTIPSQAWKATSPSITNNFSNRSAQMYRRVIDQFNVENNPRYTPNKNGRGDTYCNIFVWDVTQAMNAEIPHYINPVTKDPMYYPNTKGAKETTANRIYDWLHEKGAEYGWKKVDAQTAQRLANQGNPVVTAKHNTGKSGHVQVVCPSKDGTYDSRRGVTVAQAGSKLSSYTYATRIFGSNLSKVTYFAHI